MEVVTNVLFCIGTYIWVRPVIEKRKQLLDGDLVQFIIDFMDVDQRSIDEWFLS